MPDTTKPLIERISFEKGKRQVYLDGRLIFAAPQTLFDDIETPNLKMITPKINNVNGINLVGAGVNEQRKEIIDIGTGQCCYGYFYRLLRQPEQSPEFDLEVIRHVDFNIYDLVPALSVKTSEYNPRSQVLATGYGCSGSGVRLIGVSQPLVDNIIPSFSEFWDERRHYKLLPGFRIEKNRIHLDLTNILSGAICNSIDLTQRLANANVDIDKTLELARDYKKNNKVLLEE